MKKIILFIGITVISLSLRAQGLISIQETSFNIQTNTTSIGGTQGNLMNVANSYYFAVLESSVAFSGAGGVTVSSLTDLLSASWSFAGVYGTNYTGINAGKVNGILPSTGVAVNNWPSGQTNYFTIIGWSANEGNSWSSISNSISTGIWANTTTAGAIGYALGYGASTASAPAFTVFGSSLLGQVGTGSLVLTAIPVPEPGTLALAALGGASLLLFRRRK